MGRRTPGKSIILAPAGHTSAGLRDASPQQDRLLGGFPVPCTILGLQRQRDSGERVSTSSLGSPDAHVLWLVQDSACLEVPREGMVLGLRGRWPVPACALRKIHLISQPSPQGRVSPGPDSSESCRARPGYTWPWGLGAAPPPGCGSNAAPRQD